MVRVMHMELHMLVHCDRCTRLAVRKWETGDPDVRTWRCCGCAGEVTMTGVYIEVTVRNERGEVGG